MVDLEDRVVAALLAVAPEAGVEPSGPCPQSNVDRDLALLDAVLAGPDPSRRVRIWTNPRCVVISKRLAAQGSIASLSARLRTAGVALAVRASGGTAVVHRHGVLNISLAKVDQPGASMADAYGELTSLLGRALRRLGLATEVGPVPGAYCDGAHNLLWRGRKLAGTAAVVRRRDGRTGRLVHGSLVVWGDVRDDIRLIRLAERNRFPPLAYAPTAHATIFEALGAPAGP
jgi:octanoyl-[GcvH]:protein N-octanoyltransferase